MSYLCKIIGTYLLGSGCPLRLDAGTESKKDSLGPCGGQVVSVLAFYSDDPSSNCAEVCSFFCNIVFEKNEKRLSGCM